MRSLPSKQISVVDVPEPSEFITRFYYNFFTPDEKTNDTGSAPLGFLDQPAENFNTTFTNSVDFNRNVPRYIEMFWKPNSISNRNPLLDGGTGNNEYLTNISIRQNLDKIHYEDSFSLGEYTTIHLQDDKLDESLAFFTRQAYKTFFNELGAGLSPQQQGANLNSVTDSSISSDTISNGLNNFSSLGTRFFNGSSGEENDAAANVTSELKEVCSSLQINEKIIGDLFLSSILDDSLSPLSNEIELELDRAFTLQNAAARQNDSNIMSIADYQIMLDKPVFVFAVDAETYDTTMQVIGCIIEKYQVLPDGTIDRKEDVIIENPQINTTVDIRIKYEASYYYQIRNIAYVELLCFDEKLNKTLAAGFLISSKPIKSVVVFCDENIPPPPPSDVSIMWDYNLSIPRITWSFPVNPQRDVKYFQIFRRRTVFEPFQLIKQYDFDNSEVRTPNPEFMIDLSLVEMLKSAKLEFFDSEFDKTSSFIYAICCVDAHMKSSNYSIQFKVWFDRNKNKMKKQLISVFGAPKTYPNMFLNSDTFVDTMKDEGHSKVSIFFNPEYLRVHDSQRNDLELLKTQENNQYRLQLINADLQAQQIIEINLLDRTTDNYFQQSLQHTG